MRSAVIVAGGRSTRFGEADKAVADLAGVPMVRRVADRLTDAIDGLVVNCRDDQRAAIEAAMSGYPLPVRYAEDDEPDRGPVAGIRRGLSAVQGGGEYAFVVACDMPFVEPALVEHLFDAAMGLDAAVPRLGEWFEPTHAVYRAEPMIAACEAALDRGDPRIVEPFDELDVVVIEEDEIEGIGSTRSFRNVNTREELEAAASALS